MSSGRFSMRGRAFQMRAFAPWTLAGTDATDPAEGWIAQSRKRIAVSESRKRIMIATSRERVWIAKGE